MNNSQSLILILTLVLLLIGLTAHSASAAFSCVCVDPNDDSSGASGADVCLVCQLESGVLLASLPIPKAGCKLPGMIRLPIQTPLERAVRISHPPILF